MTHEWTPLVWLVVLFVPLLLVKRWLSLHLQGVGLLLSGDQEVASLLHYFILLPGIVLHELSHYLAAKLVGVKTAGISLQPQTKRGGNIRLGAVKVRRTDPFRESLIGLAPLISGSIAILLVARWEFGVEALPVLRPEVVVQTLTFSLQRPDALLWLYLIFSISNAMLPSESDRQAWLSVLLFFGLVAVFVFVSGVAIQVLEALKHWVLIGVTYLAFGFGLALAVDIPMAFVLFLMEKVGGAILHRHVEY
ncbi:MAG: hypothetical protein ACUVR2_06650 [Anaerolineae bacterium]